MTLTSKGFKDQNIRAGDFEANVTFQLLINNDTGEDIRAFDGNLTFTDLLDNEIFTGKLTINKPLMANSTLNWNGTLKYNQFIDTHNRLRNEQFENLKIRFTPRKILFANGNTKEY
jgi:hypothetical protein